jgi:hypothetical protein
MREKGPRERPPGGAVAPGGDGGDGTGTYAYFGEYSFPEGG